MTILPTEEEFDIIKPILKLAKKYKYNLESAPEIILTEEEYLKLVTSSFVKSLIEIRHDSHKLFGISIKVDPRITKS